MLFKFVILIIKESLRGLSLFDFSKEKTYLM